eukprot:50356_1
MTIAKDNYSEVASSAWQTLLQNASTDQQQQTKLLLLLGDEGCGKTTLFSRFSDSQCGAPNPTGFAYHFSEIRSKEDANRGDVLARMEACEISNPIFLQQSQHFISNLEDTCAVIALDLSKPREVLKSARKWVAKIKEMSDNLSTKFEAEQIHSATDRISSHIQFYVDPGSADQELILTDEQKSSIVIDSSAPEINCGIPMVFVGCKVDALINSSSSIDINDSLESLVYHLRRFCLPYGATLMFTSAAGPELRNTATLQDYIAHRLCGTEFSVSPRVFGIEAIQSVFVPSGYDSEELIQVTEERRKSVGSESDSKDPLEEIFPDLNEQQANLKEEKPVVADNMQVFLKTVKFELDRHALGKLSSQRKVLKSSKDGQRRPRMLSKGGKDNEAVKEFYRSLVRKTSGKRSSADGSGKEIRKSAKEALDALKK